MKVKKLLPRETRSISWLRSSCSRTWSHENGNSIMSWNRSFRRSGPSERCTAGSTGEAGPAAARTVRSNKATPKVAQHCARSPRGRVARNLTGGVRGNRRKSRMARTHRSICCDNQCGGDTGKPEHPHLTGARRVGAQYDALAGMRMQVAVAGEPESRVYRPAAGRGALNPVSAI
jgi:hypothetical protein